MDLESDLNAYESQLVTKNVDESPESLLASLGDRTIDRNGKGIDVLLVVGGMLIGGKVCSSAEWAEAQHARITQAASVQSDSDKILTHFRRWAEDMRKVNVDTADAWNTEEPTKEQIELRWRIQEFIYLLDAYCIVGDLVKIPTQLVPMRVRLSSVDAWTIGTLS